MLWNDFVQNTGFLIVCIWCLARENCKNSIILNDVINLQYRTISWKLHLFNTTRGRGFLNVPLEGGERLYCICKSKILDGWAPSYMCSAMPKGLQPPLTIIEVLSEINPLMTMLSWLSLLNIGTRLLQDARNARNAYTNSRQVLCNLFPADCHDYIKWQNTRTIN